MKNISQTFRSRSSQPVYDSRQPLLIRRQQFAISPRVAKPRIEGQGNRNPDQYGTGLAPRPQPPSGCLTRIMEFSNRQESEKENNGNDLPRRLLFAQAFPLAEFAPWRSPLAADL